MLQLKCDLSQSVPKCLDWKIISEIVPSTYHEKVSAALAFHINMVLPQHDCVEWLYILPLIHLLKKKTDPFDNPIMTSENIQWTDNSIEWRALARQRSKSRYV